MRIQTVLCFVIVALGSVFPLAAQTKVWNDPSGGALPKGVIDTIHFETDTAVIVSGQISLRCVVEAMKQDPEIFAIVEGFADGRGDDAYNHRLSEARAKAIVRYMETLGADSARLTGHGRGRIGKKEDAVTNFARRKAMVFLRRGSATGPIITELPSMPLPCDSTAVDPHAATIEANGQVFQITVDYAKIRRDFRAEIGEMIAQREEQLLAGEHEARKSEKGDAREAREPKRVEPVARPSAAVSADAGSDSDFRMMLTGSRVSLTPPMGLGSETGVATIGAGWLVSRGEGAVQTDMSAEVGSYRRRAQVTVAYSQFAGPVVGTAFAGWGSVSGVPSDVLTVPNGRQGLLFGGRLGAQWESLGFGAFYANTISMQGGAASQEPRGCLGADVTFSLASFGFRGVFYRPLEAQKQVATPALTSKIGGSVEGSWRFSGKAEVGLKVESLPTYAVFSSRNEQRVGMTLRLGGQAHGGQWITLPTLRMIYPF